MGHRLDDPGATQRARRQVERELGELGFADLVDDATLVVTELVTNAVLHGGGLTTVEVTQIAEGVRLAVGDPSRVAPVFGLASPEAMTGRGLRLVAALSVRWGAEPNGNGKKVWAELARGHTATMTADSLLDLWDDEGLLWPEPSAATVHRVTLGEVPTELLMAAKIHVDNLVREFALAAAGARSGETAPIPPQLAELIEEVTTRFADARDAIKRQALEAATSGAPRVRLELALPVSAADAGEDYLRALDDVDAYCRAARLLTMETPPQHRVFRQWYVGELVRQLRAAAKGESPPAPQPFDERLLAELDRAAGAQRALDRTARLYEVVTALSKAITPSEVAQVVLEEGVEALGATGGGLLLSTDEERLLVPGTVGYADDVVERLLNESPDAELPAAVALRTGQPVWLESREERDERFPELVNMEHDVVSMCAVPVIAGDRTLGALRFSFAESRLFDEEERRFVLALAAQTAQALDRADYHQRRIDLSHRFQRALLPGSLPEVPGFDLAAVYHPLGDGMELGGDFYDVWTLPDGRWAFAIGDASGTGPEAAALTAMVRFTIRALSVSDHDPASILGKLNRTMLDAGAAGELGERFCTALVGVIEPGAPAAVTLAGGGHPHPLLHGPDGTVEVDVGGSLLGAVDDPTFATARIDVAPGQTLVVYTDGTIEARRGAEMLEVDGLKRAIEGADPDAERIAESIEMAVLRQSGGTIADDAAALVLRARG